MNLQSKKKYNGIEFFFREKYPENYLKKPNIESVYNNIYNDPRILESYLSLWDTMSNIRILDMPNIEPTRLSVLTIDDGEVRINTLGSEDPFEQLYNTVVNG